MDETINLWIAKDKFRGLHIFLNKPVLSTSTLCWNDEITGLKFELNSDSYNFLSWDDEPIKLQKVSKFTSRERHMLYLLKKAYDIADCGSNPFSNDGGGSKFCYEIKNMIKPIIDKLNKDIKIYKL